MRILNAGQMYAFRLELKTNLGIIFDNKCFSSFLES